MAKKGGAGENSKKAAGQARKADAAAQKQAQKQQQAEAAEAEEWKKGSKSTAKADAAAAKQAEAARKKAEKEALLKEEEASLPSKPKGGGAKKAGEKKGGGRGIDNALGSLNATGVDDALDALSLTGKNSDKIDRHPERRYKAAYKAYEERRLAEMEDEKGLRKQQKIDQIHKEFKNHPDNPFNQVSVAYNATKDDVQGLKDEERRKKEERLGGA